MARQIKLDSYSLSGIREERIDAEEAVVPEGTTITITFSSPKGFKHNYTFPEDVESAEELNEITETTIEKAEERLRDGWLSGRGIDPDGPIPQEAKDKWRSVWNEIQSTLDIERPSEIDDFLDEKESVPFLVAAENIAESVYGRVDRGRSISIQQRLNQVTQEIGDLSEDQQRNAEQVSLDDIDLLPGNTEYYSNMKKVSENLDFEDNVDQGDVLLEDRQRTTGDLTWYNRQGDSRYFLITSVGVTMQNEQGGQVLRTFDDKTEAWNYYRENRLG